MNRYYVLVLVFFIGFPQYIKAQHGKCVFVGKVDRDFKDNYAFLYFPERKLTFSQPIKELGFQFKIDKLSKFETALFYFGTDSTRKIQDIHSNKNMGIIETIIVAVEDSVFIFPKNNLKMAKVSGGPLNNDLTDMNQAISSGDYLNFFSTHSNSPVSIIFLKALTNFKKGMMLSKMLDYKLYFEKLSENLRKSPEGIELWERIIQ